MRHLTQIEIERALARGYSERSKQFHFLVSLLFRSNTRSDVKKPSNPRPAVKTRIASA